jgi:adenylate cyclase
MEGGGSTGQHGLRIGFRTSIVTVFIAVVLFVGLTLVYLSFERVSLITRTAAAGFIEKVAQLGAEHVDAHLRTVRDDLQILAGLPSVRSAEIDDNPRLYALLAAMLRNRPYLFNLYVGYDDGSFLEMDAIDRAKPEFKSSLGAGNEAAFRLVMMPGATKGGRAVTRILSDALVPLAERPGPVGYDPRQRPWYGEATANQGTLLTGPYVFFATGEPGYTLRIPLTAGRRGVIAGDILLNRFEEILSQQKLGQSGVAFLFNDEDRLVGHPEMSRLTAGLATRDDRLPHIDMVDIAGLTAAIHAWRAGGDAQQFFADAKGRSYVAAFHPIGTTGSADVRLAVAAPLDEFFSQIIAERRTLFALALAFVGAAIPVAFWLGSRMSEPLRKLVQQTDEIRNFDIAERPRIRSFIAEIEQLGRSVFTMRSVVRSFSSFIPRPIVRQLIEAGTELELGGTRRELTVLFTDVESFTAKTERADPAEVMIKTSRYFAALSDAIMNHGGTIDKFIGDAVMAFWNAPADDPDHTVHACRAVLACLRANEEINRSFVREGWPAYRTRFGLHVGEAVVGNIGSIDRMNYTALGATVNLAARLEGLNKAYGTCVLVSSAVRARAQHAFVFRDVDSIRPKGFLAPITICELRCDRAEALGEELVRCRRWDKTYALLAAPAQREAALVSLSAFLHDYPDDNVAQRHFESFRGADKAG